MKSVSQIKIGVISGVITSVLIIYFIDPFISFVGEIIIGIYENINSAYLDQLYSEIAKGKTVSNSLLLSFLLLAAAMQIMLTLPANGQHNILKVGVVTLFFITAIFSAFDGKIRGDAKLEFDQSLAIISPNIEQSKIIKLKADFAQVNSKSSYDDVIEEIRAIANKSGVKLLIESN